MSTCTQQSSPSSSWLRRTSNGGLRASKASRSVLATIEEGGMMSQNQALGARACFSKPPSSPAALPTPISPMRTARAPFELPDIPVSTYSLAGPGSPWRSLIMPVRVSDLAEPSPTGSRHTTQTLPDDVDDESESDDEARDSTGAFGFRAAPLYESELSPRLGANTELPSSPTSSRRTTGTDESHVQIVTARPFRVHTAKARSHSIEQIRGLQLLSPPPESPSHASSEPRSAPAPLRFFRRSPTPSFPPTPPASAPLPPVNSGHSSAPGTPNSASSPAVSPFRSITPLVVSSYSGSEPGSSSSSSSASPCTPLSASTPRRRVACPGAIVKDFGALLEHIHEDDNESQCSVTSFGSGLRSSRSVSIGSIAPLGPDSAVVSLPPPPRPRNKALIRPAPSHSYSPSTPVPQANSNLSRPAIRIQSSASSNSATSVSVPSSNSLSRLPTSEQGLARAPTLAPAPHGRDFSGHRTRQSSLHSSLHSLPLTPSAVPLPASSATSNFPQSPCSSAFSSPYPSVPPSPRTPSYRSTFLPSCRSGSFDSGTFKDLPRPSDSTERPPRSSSLTGFSIPFNDLNLLRSQRASGISFSSNVSGFSARDATEAESIPIGLHEAGQLDFGLAPLSPRSSLLRDVGVEVDVQLPRQSEDCTDESESCTEEELKNESKSEKEGNIGSGLRERAKSLSAALPHLNITSLNKVRCRVSAEFETETWKQG
ncbi:hypothetical protein BDV93DRAFT_120160 [Ceratobasidium sp. AG-I]|nr:hypothetical protein BDV93DRAFT_120160 [Ceratobasidium sp. AG-I]